MELCCVTCLNVKVRAVSQDGYQAWNAIRGGIFEAGMNYYPFHWLMAILSNGRRDSFHDWDTISLWRVRALIQFWLNFLFFDALLVRFWLLGGTLSYFSLLVSVDVSFLSAFNVG